MFLAVLEQWDEVCSANDGIWINEAKRERIVSITKGNFMETSFFPSSARLVVETEPTNPHDVDVLGRLFGTAVTGQDMEYTEHSRVIIRVVVTVLFGREEEDVRPASRIDHVLLATPIIRRPVDATLFMEVQVVRLDFDHETLLGGERFPVSRSVA